jgi:hypothetical protein
VTKRDRKVFVEYVRWLKNDLGLRDYTIHLEYEAGEPEEGRGGVRVAHCACIDGAREATISFFSGIRYLPRDQVRESIVHELLHCHHDPCWRMVQSDLSEPLGKIAYYVFCDSYRRQMEFMVDGIAKAIAPRLPLIDWPK